MPGLPERDSIEDYGGEKTDYSPCEDFSTDEAAAHRNLYAMNVAAMTHTALRAYCSFVGKASTPPDDPSANVHDSLWGDDVSVKPVVARTGTGIYTITWPTTVTDELLVDHTLALRRAWVNVTGSTAYILTATVTASNVVTVRVFDAAGVANDAVGATITVFVV